MRAQAAASGRSWRIWVRRVHLWLGLSLGLLFVVIGLTGSALVFYVGIDEALHPEARSDARAPAPGWSSPVWDRALATGRAAGFDPAGKWSFEVTGEGGAIPARYYPPSAPGAAHPPRQMLWFSPDGGRIVRVAPWGGYWPLLLTRIVMGLAYACFWAVAAATAVQLVSPDQRAKALSIVVSGLTIAMILGRPAGTFISEAAGWQASFWAVAIATMAAAIAIFATVLEATTQGPPAPDAKSELQAMRRPALWAAYATTALTTAAYMGTFGYLGALLLDISRLPVEWLPPVLALFGIGAFIGLTIGGRTADHHPFATLSAGIVGLVAVSIAIVFLASKLSAVIVLVFLLGVVGFLLNPAVWARVYTIAPDAPTLVGATNSSAFQLGLTLSPLLAGLAISGGYGLPSIGWVGAAIATAASATALLDRRLSRS